ncbi:COQ7-domain-containing protein [Dacryopinax primogenitus]|uniref:5-demethoxyubiquinone hydroxylase, mitochondrial n=1 Tax=Dacryopinax primogenitus (strain DJM 731) TaxID=1858805 RepID=M5GAC4_DACPD|nr:COQ7-domain-containing protein [Dacryopinax primogenitus]EJU05774.1 COQ7-domain-containing protein [Dacryopinax primogenitus]
MLPIRRLSPLLVRASRAAATTTTNLSSRYVNLQPSDPSTSTTPHLNAAERSQLGQIIRVDQAGEIAANWIYAGQMAVLGRDKKTRPLIQEMWDQEKKHLLVMDRLQAQHRVRPTILAPVAQIAGFGLGAVTALMGRDAAMACTEAVETVIGEHYDDQLKALESMPRHPSLSLLKDVIVELRDDELEHLGTAVENNSQRTPQHALLTTIVETGCKVAIELCKRV